MLIDTWDIGPEQHPLVALANDYLAHNAAESGADVLIADLAKQLAVMHDALRTAEKADGFHANCEECEGLEAPEACGLCFPLADDARLKRRAALGVSQPTN